MLLLTARELGDPLAHMLLKPQELDQLMHFIVS